MCGLKPKAAFFSGECKGVNVAGPSHIAQREPALQERVKLISGLEIGGQYLSLTVNLCKWSTFLLLWFTHTTQCQPGISILFC